MINYPCQMSEIEDVGFPNHYFNSAAYNEIGHMADNRDSILTGIVHVYENNILIS